MATLIFVHGTGVRRESFDATFEVVRQEVAAEIPGLAVAPCYWGDPYGVRFQHGGKSVPQYETARAADADQADARALEALTWAQLLEDPLFELRLLNLLHEEGDPVPGNRRTPGEEFLAAIRSLAAAQPLPVRLDLTRWQDAFARALAHFARDPQVVEVVLAIPMRDTESGRAVARAIAAATMVDGRDHGLPALDGSVRDVFVADLALHVGQSQRAGVMNRLSRPLLGLATRWAARRRGRLSDKALEAPGDILLYQARGGGLRGFIHETIAATKGDLYVLAHSLGGIMCVDLLVQQPLPRVKGLITMGSQAPYLYEIGALTTLKATDTLPAHFPPWLNIYDKSDLLSYLAGGVFPSESVVDFEAVSRAPFPESHSAYYTNVKVWRRIKQFVEQGH